MTNKTKKTYSTPVAERMEFDYRDAVIASSASNCYKINDNGQGRGCSRNPVYKGDRG